MQSEQVNEVPAGSVIQKVSVLLPAEFLGRFLAHACARISLRALNGTIERLHLDLSEEPVKASVHKVVLLLTRSIMGVRILGGARRRSFLLPGHLPQH